ncbi:hypothetical protein B0W47_00060 [Komagataeibacter nataicola]|uniref:DUF3325 domain-containing protein n=1 Tax=Komagataeibacter nataicola TaxID=265960 RepID=A0A9N7C5H2_9PROT|nr:hypothetical protein [Komagataeibacter nataicola]AQU86107.1 hypothetical protein B0W47_00060 [Komagataeibacter nataicola]PYD67320.1 hypothetical protein CDI09_03630 [Komagataeibacter nataicola]WEQ56958.1 hypothetical protein LV564_07840 [Komagataeibacter nataicola]WNM08487.1 hypothetical protein RI056_16865 [Komagataeibacter nataicola]GBR16342.1 hypothetical protein AA0616_0775 [Komagataeibacter nataicola NRIC 0616]
MTCLLLLALWLTAFMCHAALWPARYGLPAPGPTGQRRARMMRLLLPLIALGLAMGVQGPVVGLLSWFAALSFGGLLAAGLLALRGRRPDRA